MKNCTICGAEGRLINNKYPGYIEGTVYEIFECNRCRSQWVLESSLDELNILYNLIYSSPKTPGYDRYYRYAEEVLKSSDPLNYLAGKENMYSALVELLKRNVDRIKSVLEIGSGYGYTTYSLRQAGYDAKGIDIAQSAVEFAKSHFGDHFTCTTAQDFTRNNNERFDLIVMTEVIEHVFSPMNLLKDCFGLLKPGGALFLSTPNRDAGTKNCIWRTESPPVHTCWISYSGLSLIAKRAGWKWRRLNPSGLDEVGKNEKSNLLKKHLRYRRSLKNSSQLPCPVLHADGSVFQCDSFVPAQVTPVSPTVSSKQWYKRSIHSFTPFRQIENALYKAWFRPRQNTFLNIVFWNEGRSY